MHKLIANIIGSFIPKQGKAIHDKSKNLCILGKNNKVVYVDASGKEFPIYHEIPRLKITIRGKNNVIKLSKKNLTLTGTINIDSSNAVCVIDENVFANINVRMKYGSNQSLHIKKNTTIIRATFMLDEEAKVEIGENCLISTDVLFQASDGHAVVNNDTGKILNPISAPLIIEDHCWIGTRTLLCKNTHIRKNSVLGGGSVATKDYQKSNVMIAGNPAKIIKENINWLPQSPWQMEKETDAK